MYFSRLFIIASLLFTNVLVAPAAAQQQENIVLLPLEVPSRLQSSRDVYAASIQDALRGKYTVIYGPSVNKALNKFLSGSVCTSPNCIQEVANEFNAELIVDAQITQSNQETIFTFSLVDVSESTVLKSHKNSCLACDNSDLFEFIRTEISMGIDEWKTVSKQELSDGNGPEIPFKEDGEKARVFDRTIRAQPSPVTNSRPANFAKEKEGLSWWVYGLPLLALGGGGGGGGGGDTSVGSAPSPTPDPTPDPLQQIEGDVVKGPLQGATVFLDFNNNGALDTGEPFTLTDNNGSYSFQVENANADIVVITNENTVDTSSGEVVSGLTLKAPQGSSIVSPLTTLFAGGGISEEQVKSSFGIRSDLDLKTFNPFKVDAQSADAIKLEKLSLQIVSSVKAITHVADDEGIDEVTANQSAFEAVIESVAEKARNGLGFSFVDEEEIESINQRAQIKLGELISWDAEKTNALNSSFGAAKSRIQEAEALSSLSGNEAREIFRGVSRLDEDIRQLKITDSDNDGVVDYLDPEKTNPDLQYRAVEQAYQPPQQFALLRSYSKGQGCSNGCNQYFHSNPQAPFFDLSIPSARSSDMTGLTSLLDPDLSFGVDLYFETVKKSSTSVDDFGDFMFTRTTSDVASSYGGQPAQFLPFNRRVEYSGKSYQAYSHDGSVGEIGEFPFEAYFDFRDMTFEAELAGVDIYGSVEENARVVIAPSLVNFTLFDASLFGSNGGFFGGVYVRVVQEDYRAVIGSFGSKAVVDSDGDGISDLVDQFPNNPNETSDSDDDGVGDNADAFPNDGSESADSDGDGVGDNADAFPNDSNETADLDNDGVGDNSDPDRDGDGVANASDAFPNDGNETADLDNDGVGDNSDPDRDGDGVANGSDAFPNDGNETTDLDNDGVGDNSDPDRDGDGVANGLDAFPNDGSETSDSDGDGVGDNADVFDDDPTESADADGDGVGDNADAFDNDPTETADTDGDGVGDNTDVFDDDPTESADADGDGVGDNADVFDDDPTESADADGDGVGDNADAFDNDPTETTDSDGDGVGDNADVFDDDPTESADADGDGVGDNADAFDNDPTETADTDGDGVGDNTDVFDDDPTEFADADGDGVGDNADAFDNDPTETSDADGDGVGDNADVFDDDPTESADADGDGVGDNADVFDDDPTESADADGDGVGDNADAFDNDPTETADSDGDGVGDNGDFHPSNAARSQLLEDPVVTYSGNLQVAQVDEVLRVRKSLVAERPQFGASNSPSDYAHKLRIARYKVSGDGTVYGHYSENDDLIGSRSDDAAAVELQTDESGYIEYLKLNLELSDTNLIDEFIFATALGDTVNRRVAHTGAVAISSNDEGQRGIFNNFKSAFSPNNIFFGTLESTYDGEGNYFSQGRAEDDEFNNFAVSYNDGILASSFPTTGSAVFRGHSAGIFYELFDNASAQDATEPFLTTSDFYLSVSFDTNSQNVSNFRSANTRKLGNDGLWVDAKDLDFESTGNSSSSSVCAGCWSIGGRYINSGSNGDIQLAGYIYDDDDSGEYQVGGHWSTQNHSASSGLDVQEKSLYQGAFGASTQYTVSQGNDPLSIIYDKNLSTYKWPNLSPQNEDRKYHSHQNLLSVNDGAVSIGSRTITTDTFWRNEQNWGGTQQDEPKLDGIAAVFVHRSADSSSPIDYARFLIDKKTDNVDLQFDAYLGDTVDLSPSAVAHLSKFVSGNNQVLTGSLNGDYNSFSVYGVSVSEHDGSGYTTRIDTFHDGYRVSPASSGTATFTGNSVGILVDTNVAAGQQIRPTTSDISANFDFSQVSGSISSSNTKIENLTSGAWEDKSALDFSLGVTINTSEAYFHRRGSTAWTSGGEMPGIAAGQSSDNHSFSGSFYGENATELGGSWWVKSSDGSKLYMGAFGAKQ